MEKTITLICVYLAVDKDGTEKLFKTNRDVTRMGVYNPNWDGPNIYMPRVKEKTYWSRESIGGSEDYDSYVKLPKGTIKKLIGKELTWEDDLYAYCG